MTPDNSPRETDNGLWCEVSAGDCAGRAALFVDRDGVIVEDTRYLGRSENLRALAGAAEAIARCNDLGIPVVLVTNQSGVARRYYDWQDFREVQAGLAAALASAGARLDAVFACAYHAEGSAPFDIAGHPWRKPNPGMILAAGQHMKLDLSHSWIVGDRSSDIAAGRAAYLEGGILISTPKDDSERKAAMDLKTQDFLFNIAASLADAVSFLLARGRLSADARRRGSAAATPS